MIVSNKLESHNIYNKPNKTYEGSYITINAVHEFLLKHKITIRATASERLIITDEVSGEEYVVKDLGYPT